MMLRTPMMCALAVAVAITATSPSRAEPGGAVPGRNAARDTYQRGKVAYDAGDFALAARMFAEADTLGPNPKVLEMAMASAGKADDPVLGMALVERAEERGLTVIAKAGRDVFASKAGQVSLVCPDGTKCSATLDGAPLPAGKPSWVTVGAHHALLEIDGKVEHVEVKVVSGGAVEVRHKEPERIGPPSPPPAAEPVEIPVLPVQSERSRPNPIFFWGAAGTTAALGVATILSGLDTASLHDGHEANPRDAGLVESGESAQTRTNVLLVSTAVFAVATGVIGYLVFRPKEISHGSASAR